MALREKWKRTEVQQSFSTVGNARSVIKVLLNLHDTRISLIQNKRETIKAEKGHARSYLERSAPVWSHSLQQITFDELFS